MVQKKKTNSIFIDEFSKKYKTTRNNKTDKGLIKEIIYTAFNIKIPANSANLIGE